jgi:type II secretory pathway pseudopilin PulG
LGAGERADLFVVMNGEGMGQRRAVPFRHGVPAAVRWVVERSRRARSRGRGPWKNSSLRGSGRHADVLRHDGQAGFALIEVIVAAVVLVILLTGIGIQLTSEFGTIGAVRNEQAGEAVLTKALAEVRAMPFKDIVNGLSTTDPTATGTATYICISGTTWTLKKSTMSCPRPTTPVINKYTPTGSNPPAPFYPHVSTTTVNSITFNVRAFPSKYKTGAKTLTNVYRVTVVVTWKAPSKGTPLKLVGQTVVYSKTSTCATLSNTNAPYSAPCIPNFTSTAFAGLGTISLTRATAAVTMIRGLSLTDFSLELPGTSETSALTQISTVTGTARASGATVTPGSTGDQVFSKATAATNDLAQGSGTTQSASGTSALTSLTKSSSGVLRTLTATPSSGDTVASLSTIAAKSATACKSLSTVTQSTTLPCARGTATQVHTASLNACLWGCTTATKPGTVPLASIAPTTSYANQIFSARYANGGTTCSAASSGCMTSSVKRGLGTVRLVGIPKEFITDRKGPGGFSTTNYLLQLTNYHASATAWAKSSTARTLPTATVAGTVSYYTFTTQSYKPIVLTGATRSATIPTVTATDTAVDGGAVTLTIATTVSFGSKKTSATGTATCVGACTYKAAISAPVVATITYDVTQGATVLADFVLHVNLGETLVTASYQKAT